MIKDGDYTCCVYVILRMKQYTKYVEIEVDTDAVTGYEENLA